MHPRGTSQHNPDSIVVRLLRERQRNADLAKRASELILNLDYADKNQARAEYHHFNEGKQLDSVKMKPLHKSVPGSGYALAERLIPGINPNQFPKPEAALGAFPPQFHPILREYSLVDIFDLIEFYNESFRIVRGDSREEMVQKIYKFFTTYS